MYEGRVNQDLPFYLVLILVQGYHKFIIGSGVWGSNWGSGPNFSNPSKVTEWVGPFCLETTLNTLTSPKLSQLEYLDQPASQVTQAPAHDQAYDQAPTCTAFWSNIQITGVKPISG